MEKVSFVDSEVGFIWDDAETEPPALTPVECADVGLKLMYHQLMHLLCGPSCLSLCLLRRCEWGWGRVDAAKMVRRAGHQLVPRGHSRTHENAGGFLCNSNLSPHRFFEFEWSQLSCFF